MRIAFVAHDGSPLAPAAESDTGDQAGRVAALASALAQLGHAVTVYARRNSPALPGSAILAPGVKVEHLAAGPPAALPADEPAAHIRAFGDQLAGRWRRNPPDLAHAHSWTSGLAALAGAHGLDVPVVQTFNSLAVAGRRRGLRHAASDAQIRLEASIARSVCAVLASSAEEAADLARMGVSRTAVTVVPCGVDTARFSPDGPVARRNGRPRLLAAARLTEPQDLGILLRAVAAVPGAELVIAGGPARSRLRGDETYRGLCGLAASLGVRGRLTFTGRVSPGDLPALLRSADLLVSAAAHEPAGLTVLKAMACGTPVVTAAVGSHRDAVLDGTTGLLIPPGKPGFLARQLRQLLASPARLEAFGIAAADRARARYSWDRIGRETLTAYELGRPPRAAVTPRAAVPDAAVPARAG